MRRRRAPAHERPLRESRWLTMRDGVRIAIDAVRPGGEPPPAGLPAVLTMTRYWRSFRLRVPEPPGKAPLGPRAPIADALLARRYAVVVVDARGTGASGGSWLHPWSSDELADFTEVVDWVVAQPWSNGRVGATGISYEGATAMHLAASGHPAVRAVAPRSFELDVYADIVRPGGILNDAFLRAWSESAELLDADRVPPLFGTAGRLFVRGVRRVDEDPGGAELARIVAERRNPPVYQALRAGVFRDDRYGEQVVTLDEISLTARLDELRQAAVPAQVWGSWLDGTTADAALRMFELLPSVREVRIGAWSHTGEQHASPLFRQGKTPDPPLGQQWEELVRFLDGPLQRGEDADGERLIHYFTIGEERWHTTPVWPPAGVREQTLHLGPGGALTPSAPLATSEARHRIDPGASTGTGNRWHTQLARPVRYPDRRRADQRLATWTGEPLAQSLEITGHPRVRLFVRSTSPDVSCHVYLEAVDERGRVRYLTEGLLRALHRGADGAEAAPPTFRRAGARPLEPGVMAELAITLLPTSVRVSAGWRLRIALAGADSQTFERIPDGEPPEFVIACGGPTASALTVPIRG